MFAFGVPVPGTINAVARQRKGGHEGRSNAENYGSQEREENEDQRPSRFTHVITIT